MSIKVLLYLALIGSRIVCRCQKAIKSRKSKKADNIMAKRKTNNDLTSHLHLDVITFKVKRMTKKTTDDYINSIYTDQ
jgi:hypothetical protein